MRNLTIQFLLIFAISFTAVSQDVPERLIENQINTGETTDETIELNANEIMDALTSLADNPIAINSTSEEELKAAGIFNEFQISNILTYRKKYGPILTIYELYNINGFNKSFVEMIKPYIRIEAPKTSNAISLENIVNNSKNQVYIRTERTMEPQQGYQAPTDSLKQENRRYLGSPYKLYTRYRFNYSKNISFGITAEKDAGEQFFRGTQKQGFDFYSLHLFIANYGKIKSFAIGDYQLSFGQGLIMGTSGSFSQGLSIFNIKKFQSGIRPSISSNESRYFRGAAATIALGSVELSTFFSRKKLDGNIQTDSIADIMEVSALTQTGYHNTFSTIEDRKNTTENMFGGNISYRIKNIRLGVTTYHQEFDKAINPELNIYNQFDFSGKTNDLIGMDYTIMLQPFSLFGEISQSSSNGIAYLNGAIANVSNYLSFSLLHRHYARNYQNMYSNAYRQNTSTKNEEGLYLGLYCNPLTNITITASTDIFKFPWLKYRTYAPSMGVDNFVQFDYILNSRTTMYLRYRNSDKQENAAATNITEIQGLMDKHIQSIRYHIAYKLSDYVELRNRVEYLELTDISKRTGFLIYQDVIYHFKRIPLELNCRLALFDTDDYESRIYSYENDVLFAYSMPSYYYKGSRGYIGVHYKAFKQLDIWLRLSQTAYSNKETVSSGLNQINGNKKTDVKIQIRLNF